MAWRGASAKHESPRRRGLFDGGMAPSVIQRLRAVCHLPRFAALTGEERIGINLSALLVGEVQGEHGAAVGMIGHLDAPHQQMHDVLADRQTEPCAGILLIGA